MESRLKIQISVKEATQIEDMILLVSKINISKRDYLHLAFN